MNRVTAMTMTRNDGRGYKEQISDKYHDNGKCWYSIKRTIWERGARNKSYANMIIVVNDGFGEDRPSHLSMLAPAGCDKAHSPSNTRRISREGSTPSSDQINTPNSVKVTTMIYADTESRSRRGTFRWGDLWAPLYDSNIPEKEGERQVESAWRQLHEKCLHH